MIRYFLCIVMIFPLHSYSNTYDANFQWFGKLPVSKNAYQTKFSTNNLPSNLLIIDYQHENVLVFQVFI